MAERRCPGCNTLVQVGVPTCFACGHTFPDETRAGWTEGLGSLELPKTASAWAFIVLAFPLTLALFGTLAWLDWFHLGHVQNAVLGLMLLFPVVAQLLPNLRRRGGGCCLGCLTWVSVAVAMGVASTWWSFEDPVRTREVKPVPRFAKGQAASVDGVLLGDDLRTLADRLGRGQEVPFPWAPGRASRSLIFDGGTVVTVIDIQVVRVEGSQLEQGGQVLIRRGQSFERVGHLFATSAHEPIWLLYKDSGVNYGFSLHQNRIERVTMGRSTPGVLVKPPGATVNGVALGMPRSELSPLPVGVQVEFNASDRSELIRGTSLELNGKPLLTTGDAWGLVRGRLKAPSFNERGRFAGVNLAIERRSGSVGAIEVALPPVNTRSRR